MSIVDREFNELDRLYLRCLKLKISLYSAASGLFNIDICGYRVLDPLSLPPRPSPLLISVTFVWTAAVSSFYT